MREAEWKLYLFKPDIQLWFTVVTSSRVFFGEGIGLWENYVAGVIVTVQIFFFCEEIITWFVFQGACHFDFLLPSLVEMLA